MNKKETRKFVVGRLFIIVSLLAVLFVSTINGKGKDTGVAEGKSGHAVPELTVTSSSLATGLFTTK